MSVLSELEFLDEALLEDLLDELLDELLLDELLLDDLLLDELDELEAELSESCERLRNWSPAVVNRFSHRT